MGSSPVENMHHIGIFSKVYIDNYDVMTNATCTPKPANRSWISMLQTSIGRPESSSGLMLYIFALLILDLAQT